jgi:hypothetical protein
MIMSQQTQQGGIDVFIPLAEVLRIGSSGGEAKDVIAKHQNVKVAILRGYVYQKRPNTDRPKLVYAGNLCNRVFGIVFEKMNINDVAKIVYGSQQQSQQQSQSQEVQMILTVLEELPSYNRISAYLPLEYIYLTKAQANEMEKDQEIIDALKSQERRIKLLDDKRGLNEIINYLEKYNLKNLLDALGRLKQIGIKALPEHFIIYPGKDQ